MHFRNFAVPVTDNRNLKELTVNKSTLEVYSERNCHWSQKTIPLPLPLPKNASQQKIEHQGCKKKGGVRGGEEEEEMEEERQKGGEHSLVMPLLFFFVPPVWTNSLTLGRHWARTPSSRVPPSHWACGRLLISASSPAVCPLCQRKTHQGTDKELDQKPSIQQQKSR